MPITVSAHHLLVAALLVPYCAIFLALLVVIARITWKG